MSLLVFIQWLRRQILRHLQLELLRLSFELSKVPLLVTHLSLRNMETLVVHTLRTLRHRRSSLGHHLCHLLVLCHELTGVVNRLLASLTFIAVPVILSILQDALVDCDPVVEKTTNVALIPKLAHGCLDLLEACRICLLIACLLEKPYGELQPFNHIRLTGIDAEEPQADARQWFLVRRLSTFLERQVESCEAQDVGLEAESQFLRFK